MYPFKTRPTPSRRALSAIIMKQHSNLKKLLFFFLLCILAPFNTISAQVETVVSKNKKYWKTVFYDFHREISKIDYYYLLEPYSTHIPKENKIIGYEIELDSCKDIDEIPKVSVIEKSNFYEITVQFLTTSLSLWSLEFGKGVKVKNYKMDVLQNKQSFEIKKTTKNLDIKVANSDTTYKYSILDIINQHK
jgi:hypothetical protein